MLLLKETMPCLVLVTTKMIFTNKKTSSKYHIFDQNKDLSSVLVRSTVRYGSVRFCIFFHGSVRFGGSVKFLVRSNTTGLQGNCLDITPHLSYLNFSHNNAS